MFDPALVLTALILEAAVGYPDALHQRIPHPVVWVGKVINALETRWNNPKLLRFAKIFNGIALVVVLIALAGSAGYALQALPSVCVVIIATVGLAQRSLYDHVAAVAQALKDNDIMAARDAVGKIVGRDTQSLDENGVAAAALESLAESFNDGVVAPVFWFCVGGLPGLFIYKAMNTADSLVGHKEERWRDFGWAAARTDDLLNLIPARISGVLIALVGRGGWRVMWRDAPKHASPNAGWPEAAMAGALNVQLGGPAAYDGVEHQRPVFGDGVSPTTSHLSHGLALYIYACIVMWLLLAVGGVMWRL